MKHDDAIEWLFSLHRFGMKLGLENIRVLLEGLGNPQSHYDSILVAGTNGKGSTAAMIHQILVSAGVRSGLYTSPHLVHTEERIRIGEADISSEELTHHLTDIRACIERLRETNVLVAYPTFFEVLTAAGLLAFARANVEMAVLEVGLGGRLDATNVVSPILSVITTIDLDHQEQLGSTLAAIAREKAGILRRGVPGLLGDIEGEALDAIRAEAVAIGAALILTSEGTTVSRDGHVRESRTTSPPARPSPQADAGGSTFADSPFSNGQPSSDGETSRRWPDDPGVDARSERSSRMHPRPMERSLSKIAKRVSCSMRIVSDPSLDDLLMSSPLRDRNATSGNPSVTGRRRNQHNQAVSSSESGTESHVAVTNDGRPGSPLQEVKMDMAIGGDGDQRRPAGGNPASIASGSSASASDPRPRNLDLSHGPGAAPTPRAASLPLFDLRTPVRTYSSLSCGLPGEHQLSNVRLAVRAIEVLDPNFDVDAIANGIASVRWPGRLEWVFSDPRLLLDGAHNAAGCRVLADYVATLPCPPVLLFAAMKDKDIDDMLELILPRTAAAVFTMPPMARASDPYELLQSARRVVAKQTARRHAVTSDEADLAMLRTPVPAAHDVAPLHNPAEIHSLSDGDGWHADSDVASALALARRLAGPGGTVVVAGSLFLVGAVKEVLAGLPVRAGALS